MPEIGSLLASLDQPRYRADQMFNWVYKRHVRSFDDMTNFSKTLRSQLSETVHIGHVSMETIRSSNDQSTHKLLFRLSDGQFIESVYMIEGKRQTVCLSSQVGCALNCDFCATGQMDFIRNLTAGEIVDQLLFIHNHFQTEATNIVFMGMGEPFSNYEQVLKAAHLISHENGIAIGKRKVTISTSGIIPTIRRFADDGEKFKLAISLNATTNAVRDQLMPINKRYPIGELLNVARYYATKTRHRVTFEYVLMAGVNDSVEDAIRLRKLLAGLPCKVNLIPYNGTGTYQRPTEARIDAFIKPFLNENIVISVRRSKGDDIDAACGQLYYQTQKRK
ncbi:23S rRNA (adenine(2503)-C(2))-methyltransferase RlmN [candidate division KSB1 bacterium]|nr:23S rRNA (adenine(2503)-C(2))-methyltransferase RlmN [candidate division KSB1 bacterium]